ncbi:MAG: hypothetical protein B6I31_03725 [Desulfobacteraceae bacterium 4572_19]|nr:MAG: hypothetical protein B6I31_03725 [Desulfobacteraceae bacterium 4572_19]
MLNNYIKTFIYQLARRTGTILTTRHWTVLEFTYKYYEKNQVGPLYDNIERNTGLTKTDIDALFPHGINSVYTWVDIPIHSVNDICKPVADVRVDDFREVFFDNNGTTAIRDEVAKILADYATGKYGFANPSSSTTIGKDAFKLVETARRQIADCLGVKPMEIIFTGSGSEANNYAIKGIAIKYHQTRGHIITTQIEHPSVLEAVQFLGMIGYEVTFIDVNKKGQVLVETVEEALRYDTILVSVMAVNNEITAHKIYGPKGIGALFLDEDISLIPLIHGGGQEFSKRAGTENVGHIMAFGKAAVLAHKEMQFEMKRLTELRDYFLEKLEQLVPDYIINGTMKERIPTNLSVGFKNIDSGALLLSLNQIGVYVSSGSACSAGSREASQTIMALGIDMNLYGTIRFSFGLWSTKEDVDYLFKYLPDIIKQIRNDID